MENICAFVTADNICLKPPTGWARQYEKLLKMVENKTCKDEEPKPKQI